MPLARILPTAQIVFAAVLAAAVVALSLFPLAVRPVLPTVVVPSLAALVAALSVVRFALHASGSTARFARQLLMLLLINGVSLGAFWLYFLSEPHAPDSAALLLMVGIVLLWAGRKAR